MGQLWAGVAAGAVGTTALNIATYLDMVVRGRPPSEAPEKAVEKFGDKVGVSVAPKEWQPEEVRDTMGNRQSGLGALTGFATGLGIGAVYGLLRPRLGDVSVPVASVGLGLGAMAASDLPLTASGLTDPRKWGASGWASDLIPHLAYGVCTALAFEAIAGDSL
jgi:hypothetical protein